MVDWINFECSSCSVFRRLDVFVRNQTARSCRKKYFTAPSYGFTERRVKTSTAPRSHLIFRHDGVSTRLCCVAGAAFKVSVVRLPIAFQVLFGKNWKFLLKNKKPTWCHLSYLLYFLDTQHVSGINMSIFRSLRLCCWPTTLAAFFLDFCVLELGCGSARVVSGLPAARIPP